uniref:Uncharacterized protein n=1 Tax=Thermofilum pendens TaxID=2269 RepID=A0A7C4BAK7_THEPE
MSDFKFEVAVEKLDKALPLPRELSEQVKEVLGNVSRKMLSEMRKEAVQCPVLGRQVPFLQCYVCKNFVRRVRGVVYCRGDTLG